MNPIPLDPGTKGNKSNLFKTVQLSYNLFPQRTNFNIYFFQRKIIQKILNSFIFIIRKTVSIIL